MQLNIAHWPCVSYESRWYCWVVWRFNLFLTTISLSTHVNLKKFHIVRVSLVLHFHLNAFLFLFSSFINTKTLTLKNTRSIVIPYMFSHILPDVMITVGLCVLLRNRQVEVQASRYVPIPSFRLEGSIWPHDRSFRLQYASNHIEYYHILPPAVYFHVTLFLLKFSDIMLQSEFRVVPIVEILTVGHMRGFIDWLRNHPTSVSPVHSSTKYIVSIRHRPGLWQRRADATLV